MILGPQVKMRSRGCLLLWCCTLPLFAQQDVPDRSPSDSVFRAETVLMEVEVKVTDKQGRPVPDLEKGDFTLLENREPQTIRTFEYVAEPGGDELAGPEVSPSARKPIRLGEPIPPESLPRGTTWIYVTGRVNPEDRKLVWRQMTKFLDENLRDGVLISIEGGEFTSKRATLQDGLRRMIEKRGTPASLADLNSGLDAIRFGEIEYDPRYQVRVDNLNEAFADLARQRIGYFGDFFLYRYIDISTSLNRSAFCPARRLSFCCQGVPWVVPKTKTPCAGLSPKRYGLG